jgi:hypothetical protein
MSVSVTDDKSELVQATAAIVVHAPPVVDAGGPYNGIEGVAIRFDATATDPDGDEIIQYEWHFGDGTSAVSTFPTTSHLYDDNGASNPGTYTLTVFVTDARGVRSAAATSVVTVSNVAPTGTLAAPSTVGEGTAIQLSVAGVDAAGDRPSLKYAFDCGDGAGYGAFGSSSVASCPTVDNGTRVVKAKIVDKDGGTSDEYTAPVTITNVLPQVAATASASQLQRGDNLTLTFSFTDPGVNDAVSSGQWGYEIQWGDGTTARGGITPGAQLLPVHRYKESAKSVPVQRVITVRVWDKEGAAAGFAPDAAGVATLQVTVVR